MVQAMIQQNEPYIYGYHDGLRGLEARYMLIGTTLHIKILGSNIWRDYLDCVLFAWPRVRPLKNRRLKFHRKWWDETEKFHDCLKSRTKGNEIMEYSIIGHSAGGSQAYNLIFLLPPRRITVTSVNSPKFGNRAAVEYVSPYAICESQFDAGDLIHRWPFLYARNPKSREYAHTRGPGRAHNNMPQEWNEFPV